MKRAATVLLALALAAAAAGCSPLRAVEALLVLDDVRAAGGSSLYGSLTADPARREIAYKVGERGYRGDLYTPGGAVEAGLVLVPGVARAGKDDPRLVAFATTLARTGFVVLVPDLVGLKALRVGAENVVEIADALRHLSTPAAGGAAVPVGLVAISFAAGPALIAALRDDTRGRIRFVHTIGGYYDIAETLVFVTTGHYRPAPGASWIAGRPNDYGKWVFVASNVARLADPGDRTLLRAVARRKLADRDAGVDDLASGLGAEGRAIYAVATNRDPDRVAALLAALPPAIRAEMRALDPSRHDLARLDAEIVALHGRDDPMIPYTQSVALAAAANAARAGSAEARIVSAVTHVELTSARWDDLVALWRTACRLLALRDAMSPPAIR